MIERKSMSYLLKRFNPKAGRPVPLPELYAANTLTASEFESLQAEANAASARNWARYNDQLRAEAYANTFNERWGNG